MAIFQSLLDKIKRRNFRGMEQQTQKLDPQMRQQLAEFLEDVPAERDELHLLQDELNQAHERLNELQSKEQFVGTRLRAYQAKLVAQETPDPKHVNSLQQIESSHQTMVEGINVLQERISHMEIRQQELKYKTEECQAVLDTAARLELQEAEGLEPSSAEQPQPQVQVQVPADLTLQEVEPSGDVTKITATQAEAKVEEEKQVDIETPSSETETNSNVPADEEVEDFDTTTVSANTEESEQDKPPLAVATATAAAAAELDDGDDAPSFIEDEDAVPTAATAVVVVEEELDAEQQVKQSTY